MRSSARGFAADKSFWPITAVFLGLICLADYHYSTSNQIPSDGPLTIGFPMTSHWMSCPMIVAAGGACHTGTSVLGLVVDFTTCVAFAMIAASLLLRFAHRDFVKRKVFWMITGVVFAAAFLLGSLLTAFHSAHHGRVVEIGFPVVYLREYAGEALNAPNLAVDLALCFVAAFLFVAPFFRGGKGAR
jgi:phosphatidylserine synthase